MVILGSQPAEATGIQELEALKIYGFNVPAFPILS